MTVRTVLHSNGVVLDRDTGHLLSRRTATLRANATEPLEILKEDPRWATSASIGERIVACDFSPSTPHRSVRTVDGAEKVIDKPESVTVAA